MITMIGCATKDKREKRRKKKKKNETKLATEVQSHSAKSVSLYDEDRRVQDIPFQESTLYGSKP